MTSYMAIQNAIDRAARINGKAFIRPSALAGNERLRQSLCELANACGYAHFDLTDDELTQLYAVARKGMESAVAMARDWSAKGTPSKAGNPILDPAPSPAPSDPVAPPSDPYSLPHPPIEPIPADIDWGEIRRVARVEAHDKAQALLADAMDGFESTVAEMALKAVSKVQPTNLIVTVPGTAPSALGTVHYAQATLIQMIAAGCNVYLHGPAGSGKTTAGQKVAEAFKLPFYFAAKVESEYLLLGFTDAQGKAVRTQFREAYEHGGVFLFDEMDASASGAIVALNAALANGFCPFPDGTVKRHENFKCIGAGNTVLTGANRQYTGRTQLDAASIDRFAFLQWGYDEALETAIAPDKDWSAFVQRTRKAVAERGLDHLITPRASIDGGKLIAAGMSWDDVERAVIWKGLDAETVSQIKGAM